MSQYSDSEWKFPASRPPPRSQADWGDKGLTKPRKQIGSGGSRKWRRQEVEGTGSGCGKKWRSPLMCKGPLSSHFHPPPPLLASYLCCCSLLSSQHFHSVKLLHTVTLTQLGDLLRQPLIQRDKSAPPPTPPKKETHYPQTFLLQSVPSFSTCEGKKGISPEWNLIGCRHFTGQSKALYCEHTKNKKPVPFVRICLNSSVSKSTDFPGVSDTGWDACWRLPWSQDRCHDTSIPSLLLTSQRNSPVSLNVPICHLELYFPKTHQQKCV